MIIQSTPTNTAEKDNPDNLSLAGDGFDTVIKAKAAVDAVAGCTNKVSCADILAIATRDVVNLVRIDFGALKCFGLIYTVLYIYHRSLSCYD